MARHLQLSERRFRVVQPDGGPPRRALHAPSQPQRRVFRGRLPEQPVAAASRVSGPDRPPGQANPGDDHNRKHHLQSAGRRQGGRLGHHLPGRGATAGKGGWETQTHPHLPVPISPLRGPGVAHGRRRSRLPDGQGDGRIPNHLGFGFAARNRRRRANTNPSALAATGTFADTQLEEEVDSQGFRRVTSGLVEGTFKSDSIGNTAKGLATCPWTGFPTTRGATGGRAGMGGETLRRRSEEHPASSDSI